MKKIVSMMLILLSQSSYASPDIIVYETPVSQSFAQAILDEGRFFELGEKESVELLFDTENDNILIGGGRLLGLEEEDRIEGDDKGKTFGMTLGMIRNYEQGSIAFKYLSELYSRNVSIISDDGREQEFIPGTREYYTANQSRDILLVELKRDLKNDYFITFKFHLGRVDDQSGLALKIQDKFHRLTEELGNDPYHAVEVSDSHLETAGIVGIGRRIRIYSRADIEVNAEVEVGASVSSVNYLQTAFIRTSLDLELKRSRFKFELETDSFEFKKRGLFYEYDFFPTEKSKLTVRLGVYNEENYFSNRYHNLGVEDDLIFRYGLKYHY